MGAIALAIRKLGVKLTAAIAIDVLIWSDVRVILELRKQLYVIVERRDRDED